MRTMWTAATALMLVLGVGCKNRDTDHAADRVENARNDVQDKEKHEVEARRDLAKQQREVDNARGNLTQAREQYSMHLRDRLAKIDAKIQEDAQSSDAKLRDKAAAAKPRRDELARKVDDARTQSADQWDSFKKGVDDSFDSLEKDLDIH